MGNGMNKILPGLYVGNFRDSRDGDQLNRNHISHILSVYDNATPFSQEYKTLCINAADHPSQDLTQFISRSNDFIHNARLSGGNVLVHCIAGCSRSVTLTTAYLMTISSLGWQVCLKAVKASRQVANPNFGFQKQLQIFEATKLSEERRRFRNKYGEIRPIGGDAAAVTYLSNKFDMDNDGKNLDSVIYPLGYHGYRPAKATLSPHQTSTTNYRSKGSSSTSTLPSGSTATTYHRLSSTLPTGTTTPHSLTSTIYPKSTASHRSLPNSSSSHSNKITLSSYRSHVSNPRSGVDWYTARR